MPNNKEPEIDFNLCFLCMPPIVIPVSDRAKKRLGLEEGCVGAIFLEDDAMDALAVIMEGHWIVGETDTLPEGELIKLMNIKVLH